MSFDFNMKKTKCGDTFIAVIHSLSESSSLYMSGFRAGDKITCEKNTDGDRAVIHVHAPFNNSHSQWLAVKSVTDSSIESLVFDKFVDKQELNCAV